MKLLVRCACCGELFDFETGTMAVKDGEKTFSLGPCCAATFLEIVLEDPWDTPGDVILAKTKLRLGN